MPSSSAPEGPIIWLFSPHRDSYTLYSSMEDAFSKASDMRLKSSVMNMLLKHEPFSTAFTTLSATALLSMELTFTESSMAIDVELFLNEDRRSSMAPKEMLCIGYINLWSPVPYLVSQKSFPSKRSPFLSLSFHGTSWDGLFWSGFDILLFAESESRPGIFSTS